MTKVSTSRKFRLLTFLLAAVLLLGAFAGCKTDGDNGGTPSGDVVSSQINVVNDIYHEVYIEEGLRDTDKGLVVGIHSAAMEILTSADKVYDGETEVFVVDGKVKGLTGKTLGSENNELKIVKGDKEYTLKYMYVTRAIRNVNDLSINRDQFPSAPWINGSQHPEGLTKYTPYIFEMDIASLSYSGNVRVPTIEVEGYYVLAADIDVGNTDTAKYNTAIKAMHADYRPSAEFLKRTDVGFTGTFDGHGHKIENITTWQGGVFGYINGGTIKNTAFINACNYWQSPDKHFFADYVNNANFENLYVKLRQQKVDNGSGNYYEYWVNIFGDGTVNAKDCVLESFILEEEADKNTNYVQFINANKNSTYENVHCVGSSPLAITSNNYSDGVQIMVTEKELAEFEIIVEAVDTSATKEEKASIAFPYMGDGVAYSKYYYVMSATNSSDVILINAPSGVEKYDTINKFNATMKSDSILVKSLMDTGYWNYDSATGALTWKNI